jgi:polyisoprenoid-binding protein YceI
MTKRLLLLLAVLPGLALAADTTWTIDPSHSHASFTIRHMVISNVRGEFGKTSGTVVMDDRDPTRANVQATIETASIDTREPKRDAHLKSADFFDAEKNPAITFRSTKVERAGNGKLKVTGDLTMNHVTRPVVLDVEGPTAEVRDPAGNLRRGVSARTTLHRKDFGLTWNKMVEAGPVVGDDVNVEIEAELVKQGPKTAAR